MRQPRWLLPAGAFALLSACAPMAPAPGSPGSDNGRLLPLLEAQGFAVSEVKEGGPIVVTPTKCLPKSTPQGGFPPPPPSVLRQQAMVVLQTLDREAATPALTGAPPTFKTAIVTESCQIRGPSGGEPTQ